MKSLRNLRIGVRLGLGFGFVLAILMGLIVWAVMANEKSRLDLSHTLSAATAKEEVASNMKNVLTDTFSSTIRIGLQTESSSVTGLEERIKAGNLQYLALVKKLSDLGLDSEEKRLLTNISNANAKMQEPLRRAILMSYGGLSAEMSTKIINTEIAPIQEQSQGLMNKLVSYEKSAIRDDLTRSNLESANRGYFLLAVSALTFSLALAFALVVTRSITRPLNDALEVARKVAQGDLTHDIQIYGKDEVAQLLQAMHEMNGSLRQIASEVRISSEAVANGANDIATGNQDLSSRTEAQAASLEETAASMTEFVGSVNENTESAHRANEMAGEAADSAFKGGEVVSRVISTMGSIKTASKKMVDIIGVIDSIAFQTSILALNAAVEAARAGEQGKGFAVVATEIRNLAQRAAASAKEIKHLIKESMDEVQSGSDLVSEAGAAMNEIVERVERVTSIMAQILLANEEQQQGIVTVNQSVGHMDLVVQQNAALVEEAAASAASLRDQAEHLNSVVGFFKVDR